MSHAGRKIEDNSKAGGKKMQSQTAIEKEEITNTEFPEGGNTTSAKGPWDLNFISSIGVKRDLAIRTIARQHNMR